MMRVFALILLIFISNFCPIIFAENKSSDISDSTFKSCISYTLPPSKILVYTPTSSKYNVGIIDTFNYFLQYLEKSSSGKIDVTFTTTDSSLDIENLTKYDCIVLNGISDDFLSMNIPSYLPRSLREIESSRLEKYRSSLENYVANGGGIFFAGSIPDSQFGKIFLPNGFNLSIKSPNSQNNLPVVISSLLASKNIWNGELCFGMKVLEAQDALFPNPTESSFKTLLALDTDFYTHGDVVDMPDYMALAAIGTHGKGRVFFTSVIGDKEFLAKNPQLFNLYCFALDYVSGNNPLEQKIVKYPINENPENRIMYLRNMVDDSTYNFVLKYVRDFASKSQQNSRLIAELCIRELLANSTSEIAKTYFSDILFNIDYAPDLSKINELAARELGRNPNSKYLKNLLCLLAEKDSSNFFLKELLKNNLDKSLYVLQALNSQTTLKRDGEIVSFAKKIISDKAASESQRLEALFYLLKAGEDISPSFANRDLMRYISENRNIKIPDSWDFSSLKEDILPEYIKMLALRGERYPSILAYRPKNSEVAKEVLKAVISSKKLGDLKSALRVSVFFNDKDIDELAGMISKIDVQGKLREFWNMLPALSGKPQKVLLNAMQMSDSSMDIDFFFNILDGEFTEKEKALAASILKNAGDRKTEVFNKAISRISDSKGEFRESLKELILVCISSNATCDFNAILAKHFKNANTTDDKVLILHFLSVKQSTSSLDVFYDAYRQGLKSLSLNELAKWNNLKALDMLKNLYNDENTSEYKNMLLETMFSIVKNSNSERHEILAFLQKNATDRNLINGIRMFERGDTLEAFSSEVSYGIKAYVAYDSSGLKKVFDDSTESFWQSKGNNWIILQFSKPKNLRALEFTLTTDSTLDGIEIFGGKSKYEMDSIDFEVNNISENKYIIKFNSLYEISFLRFNLKNSISIKEVVFEEDWSTYTKELYRVKKDNYIASASSNSRGVEAAFDRDRKTSWGSGEDRKPGQWFFVGLDAVRKINSIELDSGEYKDNGVISPIVYAGERLEEMRRVEILERQGSDSDIIVLKKPIRAKFIRVENGALKSGMWRICEFVVR